MKIVIIDDEISARRTMRSLLTQISKDIEIVQEIDSVTNAIDLIPKLKFDVLLLDIELIDGTGFDILEALPQLPLKIIFTTAYDEHAIKAFKKNAIDYLLKPININELRTALNKCETSLIEPAFYNELLNKLRSDISGTRIAVRGSNEVEFLNSKEISYIESEGPYSNIFTAGGRKIMCTKPIKHFEDILDVNLFCRINRQELVNIEMVSLYKKNIGHGVVQMTNGVELKISRRKKVEFNEFIKRL